MEQKLFSEGEPKQLTIPGLYYQPSMFEERRAEEIRELHDEARRLVMKETIDRATATDTFDIRFAKTQS